MVEENVWIRDYCFVFFCSLLSKLGLSCRCCCLSWSKVFKEKEVQSAYALEKRPFLCLSKRAVADSWSRDHLVFVNSFL